MLNILHHFRQAPWALWLLFAAILMRAVVPAGMMPSTANGAYLQLCSATGGGQVFVDFGRDSTAGESGQQAAMDCAFAGLGQPLLPSLVHWALPRATELGLYIAQPLFAQILQKWLADRWPPMRGPPLI